MKKHIRKILNLFLILTCVVFVLSLAACSCNSCSGSPSDGSNVGTEIGSNTETSIEISQTTASIPRYTYITLGVTSGAGTPVWSSSDDSVARVDQSGKVVGLKIGTATITATIAEKTLQCEVMVTESDYHPYIKLIENELSLVKDSSFDLQAQVIANDIVLDYVLDWYTDDANVAVVENGVLKAKAEGSTTVGCQFEYDGGKLVSAEMRVTVQGNASLTFDVANLTLYTQRAQIGQDTDATLKTDGYIGGVKQSNINVKYYSENTDIATVNETSGKVTAVSEGEVLITAQWTLETGYVESAIKVKVIASEVDLSSQTIYFEKSAAFAIDTSVSVMGKMSGNNVSVYNTEKDEYYDASLSDGLLRVEFGNEDYGEKLLRISNGKVAYLIKAVVVTLCIDDASMFEIKTEYGGVNALQYFGGATEANNYTYGGYFVLTKDLDFSKVTVGTKTAIVTDKRGYLEGFTGEFDGRGYAMENVALSQSHASLFGNTTESAYIHDVKFINLRRTNSTTQGLMGYYVNGKIDNIYVQATEVASKPSFGVLGGFSYRLEVSNSTFIVESVATKGILSVATNVASIGATSKFTNCTYFGDGFAIGSAEDTVAGIGIENYSLSEVSEQDLYNKDTANDYKFNLASVSKVLLDGKDITSSVSIDNGAITVPSNLLKLNVGTPHYLTAVAGGKYKMIRFIIPTLVVTSAEQFIADSNGFNALQKAGGATLENHSTWSGYFVLANNIDFGGIAVGANPKYAVGYKRADGEYGFDGVFDGQGYTISNMKFNNYCSLFGSMTKSAVIKNTAFTDFTNTGAGMGLFGYSPNGRIENCFIKGYNETNYGVIGGFSKYLDFVNCVFVIKENQDSRRSNFLIYGHSQGSATYSYVFNEIDFVYTTPYNNEEDTNNTGSRYMSVYSSEDTFEYTMQNLIDQGFDENLWQITTDAKYPQFKAKS